MRMGGDMIMRAASHWLRCCGRAYFMCAGRFSGGQAILGRARPMEKIEVLARERAFFFGVSSGMGPQLRDDGLELRDAGGQILARPRRLSRRVDLVEDIAMGLSLIHI